LRWTVGPPAVPALFLLGEAGQIEFCEVGFSKGDLNSVAASMLSSLDLRATTVAELDDGAPLTKPGCSSRHLEAALAATLAEADGAEQPREPSPEPIDLLPESAPRATRFVLAEDEDPYEYCMKAGFSPFLPVVPPTEQRVDAMLAAIPHPPERVVGLVPPCYGAATIEKIAANAVMAGCLPEYMPVIVTSLQAMMDELKLEGYSAHVRGFDTKDYQLPQRRRGLRRDPHRLACRHGPDL